MHPFLHKKRVINTNFVFNRYTQGMVHSIAPSKERNPVHKEFIKIIFEHISYHASYGNFYPHLGLSPNENPPTIEALVNPLLILNPKFKFKFKINSSISSLSLNTSQLTSK